MESEVLGQYRELMKTFAGELAVESSDKLINVSAELNRGTGTSVDVGRFVGTKCTVGKYTASEFLMAAAQLMICSELTARCEARRKTIQPKGRG